MKDKIFGVLQRIGRSFMLPIAILPVAGLLLGVGSSFTNATMIETYHLQAILGEGTILNSLLTIMSKAGSIIFDNLPIIFAVGVAIGMAKKEKEVAALAAMISFFVMNATMNAMLLIRGDLLADGTLGAGVLEGTVTSVCGIQTLQMGVFGGIIVGLGVAALHNKFYKIQLPNALSFFSGSRFVPIISTLTYVVVGIVLYFVWPTVQNGIYALGGLVTGTGYIGTLIFGIIKRALIPFGLHHVFYLPFWQTAVGGTMEVAGQLVQGGQNIFFAQLADPSTVHFSADATRYFSGEFIFMIFGLPGAALAMYQCAKPEKKKQAGGLLLSAALACMMTGITEPLEFSFLFVAPILFAVQVILAGSAYMIAHMLNIAVGLTFSGGFIDLFLFGILQGNAKTSWIRIIPVGIIYFFLYYIIFRTLILKLNLKTPGREDDDAETKLYTKADYKAKVDGNDADSENEMTPEDQKSALITRGLGGKKNISDVDCCATRLRCTVVKPELVNEDVLRMTSPSGIVRKGQGIQVIYGPAVSVIKSNLEDYLEGYDEKAVIAVSILSPVTGEVFELSSVPDEAFSSGMMGDGIAVLPTDPEITAPVAGTIAFVFDTKHAIGLVTEQGISVMIHIGIDTVKLKGKGFDVLVETGQIVSAGQPVMRLDLPYLKKHAPSLISPVIITELPDGYKLRPVKTGKVKNGEKLLVVEKG